MQANVKMFGEDGKRILVPMPIFRMKEYILAQLGSLMQLFGISELSLTVTEKNLFPAVSISVATFSDALPDILIDERPEIIRGVFKTIMERFGFKSITVTPTEEEVTKLKQYWAYVADGTLDASEDIGVCVPALKSIDPSNIPVKVNVQQAPKKAGTAAKAKVNLGDLGDIIGVTHV